MNPTLRIAKYLWASPNSAIGLAIGLVALLLGATFRVVNGVVEVAGGQLGAWASRLPGVSRFSAVTLGHVILAKSPRALAAVRSHELVHVRQYERWGPVFLLAYLCSSVVQLARGRNLYFENRFEREAYRTAPMPQAQLDRRVAGNCASDVARHGDVEG